MYPFPWFFVSLKSLLISNFEEVQKTIWQHFLQQKEWYSRQPCRTSIIREPSYGTNERKYLHGSPVKPFFYIIKVYLVQCAWSCRQRYCTFINFDDFLLLTINNRKLSQYKQGCRSRVGRMVRGVRVGTCSVGWEDYYNHITTCPHGFPDLPTTLKCIIFFKL